MKEKRKAQYTWAALILLSFGLFYACFALGWINPYVEQTLVSIGIDIILALGLNLIIGFSGQFSLGHAGFMAIGAYTTALISMQMPTALGFYLGLAAGVIVTGIVALVVGIPTLRLKGDYLAIATLGVAEIIRITITQMDSITNGPSGLYGIPPVADWTIVFVFVVVATLIVANYVHSRAGRATLAIREDEIAAEAMGVNVTKYKVIPFVIGAMLASIGGGLHASYVQTIAPTDFNFMESVNILIIVVFGGIGSITGTFAAAIILGLLNMFLQDLGTLRMIIYALALVCIMIFKPSGLLGSKELSMKRFLRKNLKGGA